MSCYAIEMKNDKGDLTGLYAGVCGPRIAIDVAWADALKFADKNSADNFRASLRFSLKLSSLSGMEVIEHKEDGTLTEKQQVEDIGETLANAIKEMPEEHKLKCFAMKRHGIHAYMDVQVIPDDQEFGAFGRETESPDVPATKKTIIVNPEEWDPDIIDCPFADQDSICLRAATEGMSVDYCVHRGELCLDKCPLEAGAVEVRLAVK